MTRREALRLIGVGAVATGAIASGFTRMPTALGTEPSDLRSGDRLRAVAWSDGEFYGLVETGPDVAELVRLVLDGSTLRVETAKIADVAVAAGPVAMAVDPRSGYFTVARSARKVLHEQQYSFELPDDQARWFETSGIPAQEAPTSGSGSYRVSVAQPRLIIFSPGLVPVQVPVSGDSLPEASLEPVALRSLENGYLLVLTSSGEYGIESNIANQVLELSIDRAGRIETIRPIAVGLGHDVLEVRAIEAAASGFVVSVRSEAGTQFFTDSADGYSEGSLSVGQTRFALHDRIPVSGLADGWLVEVSPGVFAVEQASKS